MAFDEHRLRDQPGETVADFEAWNRDRGTEIVAAHAAGEGVGLPILHALQAVFGYIPDEAVPIVAETLNRTRAEIQGIVSFYHDFRRHPPGRHMLRLCQAEACQSVGSAAVAEQVQARLGVAWHGTTADGKVTLEPVYCLGLCACGPAAMLDGRPLGRVDAVRIGAELDEAS